MEELPEPVRKAVEIYETRLALKVPKYIIYVREPIFFQRLLVRGAWLSVAPHAIILTPAADYDTVAHETCHMMGRGEAGARVCEKLFGRPGPVRVRRVRLQRVREPREAPDLPPALLADPRIEVYRVYTG